MANIENVKTDLNLELHGVWVPFALDIELKIARARNSKYKEVLRNLVDPKLVKLRNEELDLEELAEFVLVARSQTILLDWKNIQDKDGNEIPYSAEKAAEFFRDPELKDFHEFVATVSEDADQYRKQIVEESEKN